MERRQLLKSLMAAPIATAGLSSFGSLANVLSSTNNQNHNKVLINAKNAFNQALEQNPHLIGFSSVEDDFKPKKMRLEGELPNDLKGAFYRNGPAKHERGDKRYLHMFEGDGMVHSFNFENGEIYHQGRFIQTSKFKQEQLAGEFLYSGLDSRLDNPLNVPNPDVINTANTNVIPVGNDLWALWEGGSATVLSADSLHTKHLVNLGVGSKYGDKLKGLNFSAHPKIEANGDIWNFGLAPSGHIALFHLNARGIAKNVGLINAGYKGGMLHDFLITDKHILLILPSLKLDSSIDGYFARVQSDNTQAMRVLVVDRQNLKLKREFELEPGFAFHFGNAWEETDGTIHFDASLYPDVTVLHQLSEVMQGAIQNPNAKAQTALFTLKPNGTSMKNLVEGDSEFPRIYNHLVGKRNRLLFTLSATTSKLWNDTVSCLNIETGKKECFVYGDDYLVEEHISVSPTGKEGEGYLLGTALHVPSKQTCLNIFKVNKLSDGPICRAWLPYHIPLGFHGNFKMS